MDKITVLKSRGIGYSMMIGDNVSTINPDPVTVEITDKEIKSASKLLDESSIVSRDKEIGFMNCWNYIKSRINQ